jgi:hypothetical protein
MLERHHGRCAAGMLTGNYSADSLPKGPRGLLFRQILPGIEPLTDVMQQVAASRRKSPSQVCATGHLGGGAAVDTCLLVPSALGAHTACWEFVALPGAGRNAGYCEGNWQLLGHLQVAINWCMAQGTVPIPGAKNLAQARRKPRAWRDWHAALCLTLSAASRS